MNLLAGIFSRRNSAGATVGPAAGALIALVCLSSLAAADSVSLLAVKDNTVIQWSPDSQEPNPLLANGQGELFAGRTNQDGDEEPTVSIRRGLVQFDLSGAVPNGATITNVTLTLREVMGNNGDRTVSLYRMMSDWGEGESFYPGGRGAAAEVDDVTWFHTYYNETLPCEEACWSTPGGDFAQAASASTVVSDDLGEGQLVSWSSEEMKADVAAWLNNPASNFGWMLRGDETAGRTVKRFNSRDSTEEDAIPPTLVIEFQAGLFGDFNNDNVIDAADYVVWRNLLGEELELPNEVETPGNVTNEDYGTWSANFGNGVEGFGASHSNPAPEPTSAALLAGATIALALARWRPREISQKLQSH